MVAALERRDAEPNVDSVVFTNNDTTGATQCHTYATAGHLQTDDVGILWLQDQSESNRAAVVAQLKSNTALIFGDGALAAARAPDVFIQPNAGVIYSGIAIPACARDRAEHRRARERR